MVTFQWYPLVGVPTLSWGCHWKYKEPGWEAFNFKSRKGSGWLLGVPCAFSWLAIEPLPWISQFAQVLHKNAPGKNPGHQIPGAFRVSAGRKMRKNICPALKSIPLKKNVCPVAKSIPFKKDCMSSNEIDSLSKPTGKRTCLHFKQMEVRKSARWIAHLLISRGDQHQMQLVVRGEGCIFHLVSSRLNPQTTNIERKVNNFRGACSAMV